MGQQRVDGKWIMFKRIKVGQVILRGNTLAIAQNHGRGRGNSTLRYCTSSFKW
jgi:hypothetical protein